MLSPIKHFLHVENKQSLTFVPDQWVQHDSKSDSRLRSGTQKNKWPAWENGKFRWKSYGNSRGRRILSSSYLEHDSTSPSSCNHLPHPPRHVSCLLPVWGVPACRCHQPTTPGSAPELGGKRSGGSPHVKWHPGVQARCSQTSMAPDSFWAPHFANLQRRGSKCIEYRAYADQLHPLGGRHVSQDQDT